MVRLSSTQHFKKTFPSKTIFRFETKTLFKTTYRSHVTRQLMKPPQVMELIPSSSSKIIFLPCPHDDPTQRKPDITGTFIFPLNFDTSVH